MTEFTTNYEKDLQKSLNNFKNTVESNWYNYFEIYNPDVFSNLNSFQKYLEKPNPTDYESFLRAPLIIFDENRNKVEKIREINESDIQNISYYISGLKSKKKDIIRNYHLGVTETDKDGNKKIYVPQLIQKFKYLVIKERKNLFNAAMNSHVIIFSGGTGTGKSTQLPQYFVEFGFARYGLIACTQPRKLAVDTIQKSVSQMIGDWDYTADSSGMGLVGKKYKGIDVKAKAIQFISEGSLLTIYNSEVKKNKDYAFDEYSVIMIDEAHMRSVDIDRLLGIIKTKVIPKRKLDKTKPFLLVVMSATANLPTFEKYFGGIEPIKVEGTQKPVDIRFQKEPVNDYISKSVELAKEIHTNPESHISYLCETSSGEKGEEYGFILSFLNTVGEINNAVNAINSNPIVDSKGNYLYAYGLASDTLKSDKQLIENLDKKDKLIAVLKIDAEKKYEKDNTYPWDESKRDKIMRAVIFATNVAEASVTIDNLSYCIDSGLEYKMIYNPVNDLTIGAVVPTSKANILQRKGRVGRKQIGNYYPLFTNEINPVKQPIDQYKDLNCEIKREPNIDEIKNKFDYIFTKLGELDNKVYAYMSDLIDNLIKYLPIYEYNIYTKLNKIGLIKDNINSLSLIGNYNDKYSEPLDINIDGVPVKSRLDIRCFVNDIKTPITSLPGYPRDDKAKITFIIGLLNNPTVKFINNTNIFTGEYPWNWSNLEYCIDILDKILELYELNDSITFKDVKDISKEDIKRVKNIRKLKGNLSISQIRRILIKKLPKLNEDTEPEILTSNLTNFLLEILNLQNTVKGTSGKESYEFNVLSKIIYNEGLIINPRTENLQNAVKKLIKNGLIEVADPFGNEIRIKYDETLSKIINLPTTFENKMVLYKTMSNKNLNSVLISSIYLVSIIDYLKQQKGQSNKFINNLLKIDENTEIVDDIIQEDNIYVPGNILFTVLLFFFKYLPIVKQKIREILGGDDKYLFNYSEEEFRKDFYLEVSNVFKGENREDKVIIFFDIMRFAIELIKSLFIEGPSTGGLEFIDDLYLKNIGIEQIYPNTSEDMQEYLQRLQYSILEGYHSELCIRDNEDTYIHSTSNIKLKYKSDERILPKYLIQLESSLVSKGYLITLGISIEPSIYEIFKKHLDKVSYTIEEKNKEKPELINPTIIKGGRIKKTKTKSNNFDPIIYF